MYRGKMLALLLLLVSSLIAGVISVPYPVKESHHTEVLEAEVKRYELESRALGGGTLRILCLGASITFGYLSSDGNGYRYALRKKLVDDGNVVNMVGTLSSGTMADNQVSGYSGLRIEEVAAKAEASFPFLPNVVCIHVGTNDMTQNHDVANASKRLAALIDRVFTAVPGVSIIVSTLLPNGNTATEARILQYNSELVSVVSSRSAAGKRITLVDMHSSQFSLADIGRDGTHPTDAGYQKMAPVFYNGIISMGTKIQPPATVPGVDDAAAPNDKGTIVSIDVSCVVTVALTSMTCQTGTSKTQTCDPKTSGCPYGAITTVTKTHVSSIPPSSSHETAQPIIAVATDMSTVTTKQTISSGSPTTGSLQTSGAAGRSNSASVDTATTTGVGSLIASIAGSSTGPTTEATVKKSSANCVANRDLKMMAAIVIGMVGWMF